MVGASCPASILSRVDLPLPLSPIRAVMGGCDCTCDVGEAGCAVGPGVGEMGEADACGYGRAVCGHGG